MSSNKAIRNQFLRNYSALSEAEKSYKRSMDKVMDFIDASKLPIPRDLNFVLCRELEHAKFLASDFKDRDIIGAEHYVPRKLTTTNVVKYSDEIANIIEYRNALETVMDAVDEAILSVPESLNYPLVKELEHYKKCIGVYKDKTPLLRPR